MTIWSPVNFAALQAKVVVLWVAWVGATSRTFTRNAQLWENVHAIAR